MTDQPTPAPADTLRQRIAEAVYGALPPRPHNRLITSDVTDAVMGVVQPELDTLATLRAVSRGYCPACGRGDAAPTVEDYEQQRQRAEQAEAALRLVLGVAEVIEANGIKWAADSVRRAVSGCLECGGTGACNGGPCPAISGEGTPALFAGVRDLSIPEQDPATTTGLVVQPYRADDGNQKWVFRCWGTDTCDGWLSLDHSSRQSAERARDRHVTEAHQPPAHDAGPSVREAAAADRTWPLQKHGE